MMSSLMPSLMGCLNIYNHIHIIKTSFNQIDQSEAMIRPIELELLLAWRVVR